MKFIDDTMSDLKALLFLKLSILKAVLATFKTGYKLGYSGLILILVCQYDALAQGDPNGTPKDKAVQNIPDFPKNFARRDFEKELKFKPTPVTPELNADKPVEGAAIGKGAGITATDIPATESPAVVGPANAAVYVNSANKEHFERVCKSVLLATSRYKLWVPVIFQIGDYRNVTTEITNQLNAKQISLNALTRLPDELTLKSRPHKLQSPVWVFRSKDQQWIVEGALEIDQLFGQDGSFRIPNQILLSKELKDGDLKRIELDGF